MLPAMGHGRGLVVVGTPGLTTSGCPDNDYNDMWGAGIGFLFNVHSGPPVTARCSCGISKLTFLRE